MDKYNPEFFKKRITPSWAIQNEIVQLYADHVISTIITGRYKEMWFYYLMYDEAR